MKYHELRIVAKSPTHTELWLDDLKLEGVVNYHLTGEVKTPIRLDVSLYLGSINADSELLRKLLEEV